MNKLIPTILILFAFSTTAFAHPTTFFHFHIDKPTINIIEGIFFAGILPVAIGWASLYTLFWVLAGFKNDKDKGSI